MAVEKQNSDELHLLFCSVTIQHFYVLIVVFCDIIKPSVVYSWDNFAV